MKPNDAVFHAEANALMRAAQVPGGTLSGREIEMRTDRELCWSCEALLTRIGLQLGNPTVRIVDGTGTLWILRDGIWIEGVPQMKKHAYFHSFWSDEWPTLDFLEPYFTHPAKDFGWFPNSSNDSAGISLQGLDGTERLPWGRGRVDINLLMWGHPEDGVLLIYEKVGGENSCGYCSKGDVSRLRQWVRSLHDTPLPVGLFLPFAEAWKAVKVFMETDGQLPTSTEWIKGKDLPGGTFPDP